jgi:capsular polysaccharide transport system permease protein
MDADDTRLEIEAFPRADAPPGTALERLRQVSVALSDAARRRRLSTHRRGAGYGARRGSRLARLLLLWSFALIVGAPTLVVAIYLVVFSADQFVSEAQFTVSVGLSSAKDDTAGAITGMPAQMIIQDTQVVTNFIHSRTALDKLQDMVHIRDLYADPRADWWARFDSEKPIERFVKYWGWMSEASIEMPGGVVHFKVRAFTPADAQRIAAATIDICEQLINDMNARINNDAVANAEQEMTRASQRVASALAALERARNESGIVETTKSEDALDALVKEVRLSLLTLQGQYDTHLKDLSPDAPQMQQLKSRIEVTRNQLAEIESRLTSTRAGQPRVPADATIAEAMTKFGGLDLERKVAEDLYSSAAAALELAKVNAEDKMMYLKTFVAPEVPEEALYPKRWLDFLIVVGGAFGCWILVCALGVLVRNHMA